MSTVGLFGRQFTEVGSSSSDFLIKTKGKVKIQWGNKFIELIKDGKIAVDGFEFHKAANKESISGEDGFYITDDGGVYIKFGEDVINVFGEVGTTYVAFAAEQETLPEQKLTAQKNIGFVFDTFAKAEEAKLQNGIVYIIDEGKIYTVRDQQLQELTFDFPNPYTNKFVIQIGQGESCSLLVDGYYDENRSCLVIGKEGAGINIYSTKEQGVVQGSVSQLILETGDGNQILIENSNVTIRPTLICDSLQSLNASSSQGYRLYMSKGESVLELDNLILRKGIVPQSLTHEELLDKIGDSKLATNNYYIISDFQNEWELTDPDNVIEEEESDGEESDEEEFDGGSAVVNVRPLLVQAISSNQLNPKAIMISNPQWEIWYDALYNDAVETKVQDDNGNIITKSIAAKGRITRLKDEFNNQCNYDFKHLKFFVDNAWVYTFGRTADSSLNGEAHDNIITVQNYSIQSDVAQVRNGIAVSFQNKVYNNEIRSISNNLIVSDTFINNTGVGLVNCIIQGTLSNTYFHGEFVGQTFSSIVNPELGRTDKFTDVYMNDTEVRIVCIPDLIIPGMIVMFNGSRDIPAGWAICDGNNGTPNLVGRFIKADSIAGNTGGVDEITLTVDSMPAHTHKFNTQSIQTSSDGAHTHSYTAPVIGKSDNANDRDIMRYSEQSTTSLSGAHTHSVDLSSAVLSTEGNGQPIKIEPKYYSLIFIMKL